MGRKTDLSRRDFLKGAALGTGVVGAASAGLLAGCTPSGGGSSTPPPPSEGPKAQSFPGILDENDFADSLLELDPITDFIDEKTFDVVVIGAGTAGLPALLTALEEGATACCLQKEDSAISQGNGCGAVIKEISDEIGIQKWMQGYRASNGYRMNMDLFQFFADYSGETLCWTDKIAEEIGFPADSHSVSGSVEYADGGRVAYAMHSFGPKPLSMKELVEKMADLAVSRGAEIFYKTPGVQLIQGDDGRAIGVVGKSEDGYIKLNATKAVIVATGDYQNNDSMILKYIPDTFRFARKQYNKTGEGHLMCMLAGGQMARVGHCKQMHDMDSGGTFFANIPLVALDDNGRRFMNENVPMTQWNNSLANLYDQDDPGVFYRIYDGAYEEKIPTWGNFRPPAPKAMENYIPELTTGQGVHKALIDTHRADTLEELANIVGLDYNKMKAGIDRYNSLCDSGDDVDFGRPAAQMTKIDTPPFWCIKSWIRLTAINAGIQVDEHYQVIDADRKPIPGLFAVGTTGGGPCCGTDWTMGGGTSIGHCMTSGRYATIFALTGGLKPSKPVAWDEVAPLYIDVTDPNAVFAK
ncbi:MAG: FAD-binding protein [Coriobacteriia bacterium]|nr:FAD-binding protein [Coriobacteriia bacterium]